MDEGEYRRNAEARKRLRDEWVALAQRHLDGDLSVFETANRLQLVRLYEPDWWDLLGPFIALWDESDGLPIDPEVRALWNPEALEREDKRIAFLAQAYADDIRAAAERLIAAICTDEAGT
jgi:hypothetical protein